jgi:hypothetical protein
MLKRLKEKKEYKKRIRELQETISVLLYEKCKMQNENEFFRKEIKKLTRERNIMRGGVTK